MADFKDDDEDIFPNVPLSKFRAYVADVSRMGEQEYGSLGFQHMIMNELANSPEEAALLYQPTLKTAKKNRYMNVLPSDEHRVRLSQIGSDEASTYINASHVKPLLPGAKVKFVAAQAPVVAAINDWWRMIWDLNMSFILMLTNLKEKGRRKADQYWPELKGSQTYGDISVVNSTEVQAGNVVTRLFIVTRGGQTRRIKHLQYTGWPDHGVPREYDVIVDLFTTFRTERTTANQPILIHCSAGIGRTGSFIVIDAVIDYLTTTTDIDPDINIFNVLRRLRRHRPGSIQTPEQYTFVFMFLDYCLQRGLLGLRRLP